MESDYDINIVHIATLAGSTSARFRRDHPELREFYREAVRIGREMGYETVIWPTVDYSSGEVQFLKQRSNPRSMDHRAERLAAEKGCGAHMGDAFVVIYAERLHTYLREREPGKLWIFDEAYAQGLGDPNFSLHIPPEADPGKPLKK